MIHHEAILHDKVAQYLKRNYPNVMFRSNMEDGRKRNWSERQNIIKLNSTKSWPDIFIAEARNGYHGLFIELKADVYKLYLKDGSLSKAEHVQNQARVLDDLIERGYQATFAQGFDDAKNKIDLYLGANGVVESNDDSVVF